MKTRYSPGTGTSYPLDIDYPNGLPVDLIEISQADYEAAMAARAAGNNVDFVSGTLVITPRAPAPFETQSVPFLAEVRKTREEILNRLSGIGMAAVIGKDAATSNAILAARQALLDITSYSSVVAAISAQDFEGLRVAVRDRYKAIAAAVPADVRKAFSMADA